MKQLKALFWGMVALVVLAGAVTAQGYRVQPGDQLRIEVVEDPEINRTVLVSPDGRIFVPGAGAVDASGRTIEAIQAALAAQLTPNFANPPTVFVGLQELAPVIRPDPVVPQPDPVIALFVVGEANTVGKIEITPGTNLLQAIAQFGGFTNFAATKRIQLQRDSTSYLINYESIVSGQSPNGAVEMLDGDVIVIPQRRLFE